MGAASRAQSDARRRADRQTANAHTETYRGHLDRRASPGYDNVRALINDWFADVPDGPRTSKGRLDLGAKLRSSEDDTWRAGFWETYLHESLRRAGYDLVAGEK
jgi:hypothetical protein